MEWFVTIKGTYSSIASWRRKSNATGQSNRVMDWTIGVDRSIAFIRWGVAISRRISRLDWHLYYVVFYNYWSVCKENLDSSKNMLLLKNPQFLPNHYKTLSKWGTYEASFWKRLGKKCGFFDKSTFFWWIRIILGYTVSI